MWIPKANNSVGRNTIFAFLVVILGRRALSSWHLEEPKRGAFVEYGLWYLFPASILIATIAMTSGIGGAVFFAPLFILVLKLNPATAVGTALITEFFGFTSGVIAYYRRKLIDFKLGKMLLVFSVPTALAGSLITDWFSPDLIKSIFAGGVILIGYQIFQSLRAEQTAIVPTENSQPGNELTDARGRVFQYTVCEKKLGLGAASVGGTFLGIASVGLAELLEYYLIVRCRVPAPVAVATSIFVVVVSVLFASLGHIFRFASAADAEVLTRVLNVVMFTVPGVIIGGQLGPLIQSRVNPEHVKLVLAGLFVAVGLFMFGTVVL